MPHSLLCFSPQLLLDPSYCFLSSLVDSLKANEQDKASKSIVEVFAANGKVMELLEFIIVKEVTYNRMCYARTSILTCIRGNRYPV